MVSPLKILERSRDEAIQEARNRTYEIYEKIPKIKKIDDMLSSMDYALFMNGRDKDKIASIKDEAEKLRKQREAVLVFAGYPSDYDKPHFRCEKCSDTGYIKLKKCECLKEIERNVLPSKSTLGDGLRNCTFDTFSLSYYSIGGDNPRETMKTILEFCREYAESFSKSSPNLIFTGSTGLGKTHLSAAIGHVVSSKGMNVIYESAQKIISECKRALYSSEYDAADKYYDCDLLIIDDFGTEVQNEYTVSALTELINRRLVLECPTIISTNFKVEAIQTLYGPRLFSRIAGYYKQITFAGKDIRKML